MLSLHRSVGYVDEPFNAQTGINGIDRQFLYIGKSGSQKQAEYTEIARTLLAGHSNFKPSEIPPHRFTLPKQLARRLFISPKHIQYKVAACNPFVKRFLIKDPMACFASEYLHRILGMKTIIIIRHPASVVASYKRLGWRFSLSHLTHQDELMEHHLQPILGTVDTHQLTPLQEWAYLWLSINAVLDEYARRNPKMIIIRHEDLSSAPLPNFEKLYSLLNLELTPRIRRQIMAHTGQNNPVEAPGNVAHALKRNSAEIVNSWRRILGPDEIKEIKHITIPVAQRYYAPNEW